MTDQTSTERAAYITGLRMLADLLEANDQLPLPWTGGQYDPLQLAVWTSKEQLAAITRALPGPVTKDGTSPDVFRIHAYLAGLHVSAYAGRNEVCERVVVGTETVTVPAVEAQPERTEERDVVEWKCRPLLADLPTEAQLDGLLDAVEASPGGQA